MSHYSNFMAVQFGDSGSPWNLKTIKKDRFVSAMLSFCLHLSFFIVGGMMLIKPVQYAIDLGKNGVEVNLIAAPQETPVVEQKIQEVVPVAEAVIPEAVQPKLVKPVEEIKPVVKPITEGKDKITFHSEKGAMTQAKPDYLKNPAPPYPWEAQQKGWDGTVVVQVHVNSAGEPINVEIQKSSGHKMLDESAFKAIKKWKFKPAMLGNVPVESDVVVPILFDLEKISDRGRKK